jgi:hypothetical protein
MIRVVAPLLKHLVLILIEFPICNHPLYHVRSDLVWLWFIVKPSRDTDVDFSIPVLSENAWLFHLALRVNACRVVVIPDTLHDIAPTQVFKDTDLT